MFLKILAISILTEIYVKISLKIFQKMCCDISSILLDLFIFILIKSQTLGTIVSTVKKLNEIIFC